MDEPTDTRQPALRLVADTAPKARPTAMASQEATLESERDPQNPNRRVLFPVAVKAKE